MEKSRAHARTSFNVHGLFRFRLTDFTPKFARKWNSVYHEYGNFITADEGNADLEIVMDRFEPRTDAAIVCDDTFHVASDYFFCKADKYKQATWSFDLRQERNRGPIRLRVQTSIAGLFMVSGAVLEPIISALSTARGCPPIHAGAVLFHDGATLFAGRGGSGKSTIALRLGLLGFKMLADDRTILADEAYGLWSSLNLFYYNVSRELLSKLPPGRRLSLALRRILYQTSGGYLKFYMKVNPFDVLGPLAAKAPVKRLYILRSGSGLKAKPIERMEAIHRLLLNEQLEFRLANKYFFTAAYGSGPELMRNHWERYLKALKTRLNSGVDYILLDMPARIDSLTDGELIRAMELQ